MAISKCAGLSKRRERMLHTVSIKILDPCLWSGVHRLKNSLSAVVHMLLQSNGPGEDHRVESKHRHSQQNRNRKAEPGEQDETDPSQALYSGEDEDCAFPSAFRSVHEIQGAATNFVEVSRVRHGLFPLCCGLIHRLVMREFSAGFLVALASHLGSTSPEEPEVRMQDELSSFPTESPKRRPLPGESFLEDSEG